MIKIKVNQEKVINNFKKMIDLSENFEPFFQQIIGEPYSNIPWTLRGSILAGYIGKKSPASDYQWPALTEAYQKAKEKKYPGMPMGVASGKLKKSLLDKTSDSVNIQTPKKLVFGTQASMKTSGGKVIYYPAFVQKVRPFLGVSRKQKNTIKKLLADYITQAKKPTVQGAK